MKKTVVFCLNGNQVQAEVPPERLLAEMLREDFGLTGTKLGCEIGECGACTVILDGQTVNSCLTPALAVEGRNVTTIEGLSGPEGLHPIQEAFVEAGAVQCGFCIPGMVLSAKALLDANPRPEEEEIARAMSGNLCRCTGYQKILAAVRLAAQRLAEKGGNTGMEKR
ncbi:MAG: (2Fe-2S)-binding protein [Peptococcaceae bacterium]|nr:(2Fe-2S)-binding protein [Peptococcaceae bacterium]